MLLQAEDAVLFMLAQVFEAADFTLDQVFEAVDLILVHVFDNPVLMLLQAFEVAVLICDQAFETVFLMLESAFEKNDVIVLQAFRIPFKRPWTIKPPCSSITVLGEAIPKAEQKPRRNGKKILFRIQLPMFLSILRMPFLNPSTISPPASSM